jgi:hypothetical protein
MRWFGDWRGRIDSADAELSAAVDARDEALVALGERAVDPTACDLPLARRFAETHAALARRGEEAAARLGMLSESAAQAEADLAAAKTVDGAPPDDEALALRHARDELQRGLGAARRQVDQLAAQRRAACRTRAAAATQLQYSLTHPPNLDGVGPPACNAGAHQSQSAPIRANQSQSEPIRATQSHSEPLSIPRCQVLHELAIIGHQ